MSFCRLCGAGFEFTGEHRPGCKALAPMEEAPASSAPGGLARDNAAAARGAADTDVLVRVCEEREQLRAELAEATALLERIHAYGMATGDPAPDESLPEDSGAFLSRAPAPAAETAPSPHGEFSCEQAEAGALQMAAGYMKVIKLRDAAEAKLAAVQEVVTTMAECASARRNELERKGGQHVPNFGDFASMPPSCLRQLERYLRSLDEILRAPDPAGKEGA